jgi:hypothetical protein
MEADLHYYHQHDTGVPTDRRRVVLQNARERHWDLDANGFSFVPSFPPLLLEDAVPLAFDDPTGFAASVFPSAEVFMRGQLPGATRVICFDHILRDGAQYKQEQSSGSTATKFLSSPVPVVHNDYSVRSGRVRIEALLDPFVDDKAALARVVRDSRVSIVNLWCPLDTVERDPLAMCDWQSTKPQDVTTVKIKYSTRTGETIRGRHSPHHQWAYFPRMQRGECVLLKTWDSAPTKAGREDPSRSRFALHSAAALRKCDVPSGLVADARPRKSVELRFMVLYCPAAAASAEAAETDVQDGAGSAAVPAGGGGRSTPVGQLGGRHDGTSGGGLSDSFLSRPFVAPHIARIQPGAARSDALDVGMEVREGVTYEDEAPDAWVVPADMAEQLQSRL